MGKRKTHEEFVEQLQIINKNIEIIGEYTGAREKIKCKCLIDKNIWYTTPNNLLFGHGCPVCYGNKKKSNSDFLKELNSKNSNIKIKSEYINNFSNISCECKVCGYSWNSTPHRLLSTNGCPKCSGKAKRTQEQFLDEIKQINKNIIILSEYQSRFKTVKCKCLIDGHIWFPIVNNLLLGEGCPICRASKGEKRIYNWRLKHNIIFEAQKSFCGLVGDNKGNLKYDFFLPDYNLLIEYQGNFHDNSIHNNFQSQEQYERQKKYDNLKREYANINKIDLLEIWYLDFNNIEEILNDKLKMGGE